MKPIYLSLCLLILLFSCLDNDTLNCPPTVSRNVLFQLTDNDENNVGTVDILAFKVDANDNTKEYFAYHTQGKDITDVGTPSKKKITTTLLQSGSDKYRFVILANARVELDNLGEISTSMLKEDLLSMLTSHNPGKWNTNNSDPSFTDIPMWAETPQMLVNDNTSEITGLAFVRMLARIDVVVDDAAASVFKLKSVRVYNYNTYGQIVPLTDAAHWSGGKALKPTLPSNTGKTVEPLLYNELTTDNVALEKVIYIYEAAATAAAQRAEATCLVIGGEYNNAGKETFYRVDFGNVNAKAGVTYLDILRNHLYNVKIAKVRGAGYDTAEEAFSSPAINITADVTVWQQGGLSDIVFNGQNMLGVSQSQFTLPMNQRTLINTDNKLTITTDYPSGWKIESITDVNGDFINASWLTLNKYVGPANTNTTISLLTDNNNTGAERKAYIHISAGQLKYTIEVIQTIIPEIGLKLTNAVGVEISDMLFFSHVGSVVPPQQLNVSWAPFDVPIFVSTTSVDGVPDFNFGTGDAVIAETVNTGGNKTYMIQPPAMTQAELNIDPFLTKSLRVNFTVQSGDVFESKVLYLTQQSYAAIPTVETFYYMDGGNKNFKIKSNAPWRIEVTNDPFNVIEQMITTSGGVNMDKSDETVTFKIIDDFPTMNIMDTEVTLTIKSANPTYQFDDIPVKLRCISVFPRKRLLTIGSDPNGFGYNFSGTGASNKLITTASNFGTALTSTIKSEGFTIINGGQNPTEAQMLGWLVTTPVDMVVLGYDYFNITANVASYFSQYLNNGGVVIAFQDRTDAAVSTNLLRAVLGNGITTSYATGAGSIYQLTNIDNKVLNGPFGNIRNLQWGEDASTTVRVSGFNAGDVDILSGDRDISTTGSTGNAGQATALMHKTLAFIWVGDGGFNSNNAANDLTICPFKLNGSNFPIPKASYGRGTIRYPIYNAVFTANAIYWGMWKSQNKTVKSARTVKR